MKTMNKQEYKKWFDIIESNNLKGIPADEKPNWNLPQVIRNEEQEYFKRLSELNEKYK